MAAPHLQSRSSHPPHPSTALDSSRVADALYNWCRENGELGDVFSQTQLFSANIIPNRDVAILLSAATYLVKNHLFKIHDIKGTGTIGWELISPERAENYRELNADEQMVFSAIESAGTSGIWTKTIKAKLNQHAKVADKACRSLEIKGLIKQMKSVKNPNRKMYILADLTPNEEATGGAWFTDGSLDIELMEMIASLIELHVSKKSWIEEVESLPQDLSVPPKSTPPSGQKRTAPHDGFDTKTKIKKSASNKQIDDSRPRSPTSEPDPRINLNNPNNLPPKSKSIKPLPFRRTFRPYPAGHQGYLTAVQISNELNRMRASSTLLPQNAIAQLLDVMVYDDRLFKLYRDPLNSTELPDSHDPTSGLPKVTMFKSPLNVEQTRLKNGIQRDIHAGTTTASRKAAFRKQELEDIGLGGSTEVPCLRCPVLHLCSDEPGEGPVSVENCEYFGEWFEKMDAADREVDGTGDNTGGGGAIPKENGDQFTGNVKKHQALHDVSIDDAGTGEGDTRGPLMQSMAAVEIAMSDRQEFPGD